MWISYGLGEALNDGCPLGHLLLQRLRELKEIFFPAALVGDLLVLESLQLSASCLLLLHQGRANASSADELYFEISHVESKLPEVCLP